VIHMALHSVRFDEETEEALGDVCEASGISVSLALKRGILALRDELSSNKTARPFDVYKTIDLGPGGYATSPTRNAKRAVVDVIRRKHRR
jgi:hypothetical protein